MAEKPGKPVDSPAARASLRRGGRESNHSDISKRACFLYLGRASAMRWERLPARGARAESGA